MSLFVQAPLEDDGYCFACGQENPHGLAMRVGYEDQDQAAVCSIVLPERFQGWAGIAHGGVVSTMLDEIMAHAVVHFVGLGMTAAMESRYRAPVPLGQELLVRGWIAKHRGPLAETAAWVKLAADQQILAEAKAKFLLRPLGK